jgi:hypothetical protein
VGDPGMPPFWRTREERCTVRNSAVSASRENWLSRSLALRSQLLCLLALAIRPNSTIRRACHQSPGKVFAI